MKLLVFGTCALTVGLGLQVTGCASSGGDDTSASGASSSGSATFGGALGSGGVVATGGSSGGASAGSISTGGAAASASGGNNGASAGMAGRDSGTSGGAGGAPGAGGGPSGTTGGKASTSGGAPSTTGGTPGGGNLPHFSFFVTSQKGLQRLSGSSNGFGGDLRFGKADGLSGADEMCRQLAEASMPGSGAKGWHAFLSVRKGPSGMPVNAIDRVGNGPWYDRTGRVFAMTKAALLHPRPEGADPAIANDFPNEDGVPNHAPDGVNQVNNHHTLTGSDGSGKVNTGANDTCEDWTSAAPGGSAFDMKGPAIGLAYPRGFMGDDSWIFNIREGGCAPGVTPGDGAQLGPSGTVGASGGYGGIYCFADTP